MLPNTNSRRHVGGEVVQARTGRREADTGEEVSSSQALIGVGLEVVFEAECGDDEVGDELAVGESAGGDPTGEVLAVGGMVGLDDGVEEVVVAGVKSGVAKGEDGRDVVPARGMRWCPASGERGEERGEA